MVVKQVHRKTAPPATRAPEVRGRTSYQLMRHTNWMSRPEAAPVTR